MLLLGHTPDACASGPPAARARFRLPVRPGGRQDLADEGGDGGGELLVLAAVVVRAGEERHLVILPAAQVGADRFLVLLSGGAEDRQARKRFHMLQDAVG